MRLIASVVVRGHVLLYRLSGGLVGGSVRGRPMLLLTTTGRKSGKPRTVPLLYVKDATGLVLIGSYGGSPKHPAWFLNLQSNPRCVVQVQARRFVAIAAVVEDEDRERLWGKAVESFSGYANYRRRTTRKIPLVSINPAAL